jgi:hypothetical protein
MKNKLIPYKIQLSNVQKIICLKNQSLDLFCKLFWFPSFKKIYLFSLAYKAFTSRIKLCARR